MTDNRYSIPNIWNKNEKGQSAVEFALVMPLLFTIFLGILEYGWVMTSQVLLSYAVAEGARTAVKMPDETDAAIAVQVKTAVKNVFDTIGTISDDEITVSMEDSGNYQGHPLPRRVVVQVADFPYTPLVGFLPSSCVPQTLESRAVFSFP